MNVPTILLVEDNPGDVKLTERAMQKSRIANNLVVAGDGQEALDYLNGCNAAELPLLTLLDLQLPRLGGIEFLRRIRASAKLRRLPVVVLTSSREHQDLSQCYDLGVNSYIQKPVDFEQFSDAAHHIGIYWLLLNTPPPICDETDAQAS